MMLLVSILVSMLAVIVVRKMTRAKRGSQLHGKIAWIDTETTGLDPDVDEVLEVACIITDMQGNEIAPRFHALYWPGPDSRMSSFVADMHKTSGLLDDLNALDVWDRDFTVLEVYLREHAYKAYMGGFSVWYDRAMLRGNGVSLSMLHHRQVDVTGLDLALRAVGHETIKPKGQVRHRAMEDAEASLMSYRDALEVMR